MDPASEDYARAFQRLLIGTRVMLVAVETVVSGLLVAGAKPHAAPRTAGVLLVLLLYNLASLWVVYRVPMRRLRVWVLVILDLLLGAAAAYCTGGSQSAFLGQFNLIVFACALFYGLPGGLLSGLAAGLITVVLVVAHPAGLWEDLRDLLPYFLTTGVLTGYLSSMLRQSFLAYRRSESLRDEQALEAERNRTERELARTIQRAALPVVPEVVEGVEASVETVFASEVGGDFYHCLSSNGRVVFALGDVAGKGLPAALTATSIVHMLPLLEPLEHPQKCLRAINDLLVNRLPDASFVTMALAEIDLNRGHLRLWSAGHPPAAIWRASSGEMHWAVRSAPLLGVMPGWNARVEEVPLEAGDLIVLYSDGLTETRNSSGEFFEVEGIHRVLSQSREPSASDVSGALIAAVREWGPLRDDVTVLVARCPAVPARTV